MLKTSSFSASENAGTISKYCVNVERSFRISGSNVYPCSVLATNDEAHFSLIACAYPRAASDDIVRVDAGQVMAEIACTFFASLM